VQAALLALLMAFALDALLGDPPNRFHPVAAMGWFIRFGAGKLNKGAPRRRFWAGAALIVGGGALFAVPWLFVQAAALEFPLWAQVVLVGILLKPVFAFRGLLKAGREVQNLLAADDLPGARRMVSWHLVSRKTGDLSGSQVASAAIESLAENLTDSFFAPLLCYAVGGLPLAWAYRFVNTADAMIAYHSEEYEHFGKFTARLDDLLNWLPARLAGFLLVLSAGLCRLDMGNAFRAMRSQHSRTSSPNAGWTMAAAAGALGVVLEKPGHYRLEGGRRPPAAQDIARAARLLSASLLFCLLCCGGVIIVINTWL
jgi:adenosylcobinamide-phosphate synthase